MEKRLPLPAGTLLQQRYRIMRQLGHGGFGAVYEAVDDEIGKSFALKETFYAANEELRQAFKREARMLASLEHDAFPNVSHYFTEGDGCFLVMELVRGDDLDKLLSQRGAPFEQEEVLTWAEQILDALHDLHSGGIVHRDIKPSNLKLTPKGRIKLLDFGIAKGALEGETTVLTTVGSLAAATLQYAPLEQILKASPQHQMMLSVVSPEKVIEILQQGTTAASDLYALAATLYQLLTKQLPADAATRAISIWSGKNDPLIPAHQANPQVSNDVSEVLRKAMQLERGDRLQTAAEMRQLLNEAVTPVETVKAESVAADQYAPTVPFLPSTHVSEQVTQPSPPAEKTLLMDQPGRTSVGSNASNKTNKSLIYAGVIAAPVVLLLIGLVVVLSIYLTKSSRKFSNNGSRQTSNRIVPVIGPYQLAHTLTGHNDYVYSVAFSPDGKTIASGGRDNAIKLWDASSGALQKTLEGHTSTVWCVTFSPDGKTIASGSSDSKIKLWNAATGELKQTLTSGSLFIVAFSPDGKTLVSSTVEKTIDLWDVNSGTLLKTLTGHSDRVRTVAFSPDGQTIASGSQDRTVKLWDAASGTLKQTITGYSDHIYSVAFSPDSKTIASAASLTIKLNDVSSGLLQQTFTDTAKSVLSVAFSPDGRTVAAGTSEKTITLWDVESGKMKQTLTGHGHEVWSVAFSPDGKTLASASWDKTIKVWRAQE